MAIESIFYLPNRLRQSVLVNSNKISYAKFDEALLDTMADMFYIPREGSLGPSTADRVSFRIVNFLSCYKKYFTSTMFYESLSITMRMGLFNVL